MSRARRRILFTLAVGLFFIVWRAWSVPVPVSSTTTTTTSTSAMFVAVTGTNALVVRTVDGDTVVVRVDGEEVDQTVRLLGVDTPETVDPRRQVGCFGKEASAYTALRLSNRRVRLDADLEADNRDKYDRLLRNIVLMDEAELDFNGQLVREGYAYAYTGYPQNKDRKVQLRFWQDEAMKAERGLWDPKTCAGKK